MSWAMLRHPLPHVQDVTIEQARPKVESGEWWVLDVREDEEWQRVHIPGAHHISQSELATRLAEIPRSCVPLVVCHSGMRSHRAAQFLKQADFPGALSLAGGTAGWEAAGLPVVRGEYREAWAVTERDAGSDLAGLRATAVRDGDEWVINGEKWFVTSEGPPGFYLVVAVAEGEQTIFIVPPGTPGMRIARTPGFLHDPYLDLHPEIVFEDCRVPEANRVPGNGNAGTKEWFLVERLFIAARCCGIW